MRTILLFAAIFLAVPAIAQTQGGPNSPSATPRLMTAPFQDPWDVAGTHSPNLNLSDAIGSTSPQGRADDCVELRPVPTQAKSTTAQPYQAVMTTGSACR